MNVFSILRLASKALSTYRKLTKGNKINRRIVRYSLNRKTSTILKSAAYKALGGYDIWGDWKLFKEEKPKATKQETPKETKTKEYAIYKMWKSLSESQKKQFREWFRQKAMSQARVARSFTFENELRKLQARVTRISNKYFLARKQLTRSEKEFVATFSEFFGEMENKKGAKLLKNATHKGYGWFVTRSSWLLRFKYEGEKGKDKKGELLTKMVRSGKIYVFPNFPYVEYVLLKNCSGSIGKYWWNKWLWRYSTNSSKYSKYWFKGRKR